MIQNLYICYARTPPTDALFGAKHNSKHTHSRIERKKDYKFM